MIDTSPIPMIMALLTLNAIRKATKMPPRKIPIHIYRSSDFTIAISVQ